MAVRVLEVSSSKDLQLFDQFPGALYRGYFRPPTFPRPALSGEFSDPLFSRVVAQPFLALKNGYPAGRLVACIHLAYPVEQTGFFGYFESINDTSVASALLESAGRWLAAEGRQKVIGPVDLSPHERLGLLVEGFNGQHLPGMPFNQSYYGPLLEQCGLSPEIDLYAFQYDLRRPLPARVERVAGRAARLPDLTIRCLDFAQPAREGELFALVHNESLREVWGYVPLSPEEGTAIWRRLKGSYDPGLILVAEIAGEPAGLCLVLSPHRGRLPAGPALPRARLAVLAVRPRYRFKGLEAVLLQEGARRARARGITSVEISQVAENNLMMNRIIKNLELTDRARVYRIYKKRFDFCY